MSETAETEKTDDGAAAATAGKVQCRCGVLTTDHYGGNEARIARETREAGAPLYKPNDFVRDSEGNRIPNVKEVY